MTQKRRPFKPKAKPAPKPNVDKLSQSFDIDFQKILPLIPLPDGSVVYKNYIVKEASNGYWNIYSKRTGSDSHGQFNLKSCALMAAKALTQMQIDKFNSIKMLDTKYWANYQTTVVCKHHIKSAKDFERYLILLNKLEHSTWQADNCKEQISKMFRWSFV